MAVKIEFETSNAEFADNGYQAVAQILRDIADSCENGFGFKSGKVRDLNGNRIGSWKATIDAEDEDARDFREASE